MKKNKGKKREKIHFTSVYGGFTKGIKGGFVYK